MIQKQSYKLIPNKGEEKFIIFLQADSNDGDYIGEETTLNIKEFEELALEQLRVLKKFYSKRHQFENFSSEIINIPYSDWGNCHSLEELKITFIDKEGKSYNVELDDFTDEELKAIECKYGDNYSQYLQDLEEKYCE